MMFLVYGGFVCGMFGELLERPDEDTIEFISSLGIERTVTIRIVYWFNVVMILATVALTMSLCYSTL